MEVPSKYYDTQRIARNVREGHHRLAIGNMWDEMGALQLSFMRARGLQPYHTLVDIGCGSLRGGVLLIEYLNAGNYFGMDLNQSLLDAGYDIELERLGLEEKLPRGNLLCDGDFAVERFGRSFDFALAFSLFTHLPLNHIRVCMEKLLPCMVAGGHFFATYFETPPSRPTHLPQTHEPGGLVTQATAEPYHYRYDDLAFIAKAVGWSAEPVEDFDHPRDQRMMSFTR